MWFLIWFFGGQLIELLVVYFFPEWLARLAVLPAGPTRSIEIPPHAANAMSTVHTGATDYRTAAGTRSLDVARLPGPSRVDTADATLFFSRRSARVLARAPWEPRRRVRPLVRVDMKNGDDRIVLRPRYYPTSALLLMAAMISLCVERQSGGPLLLAAFALPILTWLSAREARRQVDAVATEVTTRLRHLEYLASDAHVAAEPPLRVGNAPPNTTRVAVHDAELDGEDDGREEQRRRGAR